MDSREILLEGKKGGVWKRIKKKQPRGREKRRRYVEWSRDEIVRRRVLPGFLNRPSSSLGRGYICITISAFFLKLLGYNFYCLQGKTLK